LAGIDSGSLRSSFVAEVTAGTTPTSPAFTTTHKPFIMGDDTKRLHQASQTASGALLGDRFFEGEIKGGVKDVPMVYGLYDPWFESLFQGAWSSNVLLSGRTPKSFTLENTIAQGQGGTLTSKRYKGVQAVGGSLATTAGGAVNLSLDVMGTVALASAVGTLSGATYTAPSKDNPFGASGEIGVISIAGFTLDEMVSFSVDFNPVGRDPQKKLGSVSLAGITLGALQPTIKMRFFMDANLAALYDAARLNTQTAAKITLNIGSDANEKYKFEFLSCYIDMAVPDYSGATSYLDVTATAAYSAADGAVVKLTRAIA